MHKRFVVDSSVFLYSPYAMFAFEENQVIIPMCVVREMAEKAKGTGEARANAVEFNKLLERLYQVPGEPVLLDNDGSLEIVDDFHKDIYAVAEMKEAIIVSRDASVRLEARIRGLRAEPFKAEQLTSGTRPYEGRCNLYVSAAEMAQFATSKELILDRDKTYYATNTEGEVLSEDHHLTVNEYVTLINSSQPNAGTLLGRYDGKKIVPLYFYLQNAPVYGVTARNAAQMFALDALMDPNAPLVILQGPAGTAAGLHQTLETKLYRRILLTRPNAKMDADVGFLKGDEKDKVLPTLRGLLDNVENLMPSSEHGKDGAAVGSVLDDLMASGIIEPQAMAYMRGRSICGQYMVVDEMQNSTVTQALSIITRIGENSKIVLLGDPNQIDNPYLDRASNGLVYAAERMKGSPFCWQLTFTEEESTRSPLARDAIQRMTPKGLL